VRTGSYVARGALWADAMVLPDPDMPGGNLNIPGKSEKVEFLFGYLQR
jgi:hypothetical protein